MKILLTGAEGFVGSEIISQLKNIGVHEIAGFIHHTDSSGLQYKRYIGDITDKAFVQQSIKDFRPQTIIHCAALSHADHCEESPAECRKINVEATVTLAAAAKQAGGFFIFLSTSFVFDGKAGPYRETDKTNPINVYGQSKLEAEEILRDMLNEKLAIIRTVMVYGKKPVNGRHNILTRSIENLKNGVAIRIVNDQQRSPTYVKDLAKFVAEIAIDQRPGIFHISGTELMLSLIHI